MRVKLFLGVAIVLALGIPLMSLAGEKENAEPQAVKAIDWKELSKVLPEEIPGMKAGDVDGGTFTMSDPSSPGQEFSHSSVEREYTAELKDGEEKEIKISIMDSGLNQAMIAPFTMMMEYDSPDGSIKATTFKDYKGWQIVEKEKGEIESTQIVLLISDRVLVSLQGNEHVTMEELTKVAEKIDFDKLAELAK